MLLTPCSTEDVSIDLTTPLICSSTLIVSQSKRRSSDCRRLRQAPTKGKLFISGSCGSGRAYPRLASASLSTSESWMITRLIKDAMVTRRAGSFGENRLIFFARKRCNRTVPHSWPSTRRVKWKVLDSYCSFIPSSRISLKVQRILILSP